MYSQQSLLLISTILLPVLLPSASHCAICRLAYCHYHGNCSSDALGEKTCSCDSSYTGSQCETDINRNIGCSLSYCNHHGDCSTDGYGIKTCVCSSGFSGTLCQDIADIDDMPQVFSSDVTTNISSAGMAGIIVGSVVLLLAFVGIACIILYFLGTRKHRRNCREHTRLPEDEISTASSIESAGEHHAAEETQCSPSSSAGLSISMEAMTENSAPGASHTVTPLAVQGYPSGPQEMNPTGPTSTAALTENTATGVVHIITPLGVP
eukprot:scpid84439/ scgid28335/ 